jgi:3-deoxy-manno-octulosonate cytidylyltransferase (CMP-KDO synthetase)
MSQMATMPTNPIIIVPARLASTRLPGKPLADIHGDPMIVHVWRRAMESGIGPVVVACAEAEIADAVTKAGGRAVLTRPDHPSGSDRIFEALQTIDPGGSHDAVVNVQGDLPTIAPETIRAAYDLLNVEGVDIGTLAVEIEDASERGNPNVVKAVVERAPGARTGRALYFTRAAAPTGEAPLLHHIGLYAYRRSALARFVSLPPSHLEQQEKLEQLRALAAGMRIDVAVVDAVPLGVDTPADLARARVMLGR